MDFTKLIRFMTNPTWAISVCIVRYPFLIKNDEQYIKWDFYHAMRKWPNLSPLKGKMSFNEKLCWLKIHTNNSILTDLVDKNIVKKWVVDNFPEIKVIHTLGVWDNFDDIDFEKLPKKFVLKCTHDSGGVVICKNIDTFDKDKAKKRLEHNLQKNFFWQHREYPYKNVKPRIIAEEFMVDESGSDLKDYKFFCFNGKPKMLQVATNREHGVRFDFYDMNFKHLPFTKGHPWAKKEITKPMHFEKMVSFACRMSKMFPFVRVDFYNINGEIYFGELTFFPGGGVSPFKPNDWDYIIGEWLQLPI